MSRQVEVPQHQVQVESPTLSTSSGPDSIKVSWRIGKVAQQWKYEEDVTEQFGIASLLDFEGKIYFSFVARYIESFLSNPYIDTASALHGY